MIEFALRLSHFQIQFLRWVKSGCPEKGRPDSNQYIRGVRSVEGMGLVSHHYPQQPPYRLTPRGRKALELIDLCLEGK